MASGELNFGVVSEAERRAALTLVLRTVPADQRGPLVEALGRMQHEPLGPFQALIGARCDDRLVAATWAQPQPGRTAALWRPECDGVAPERVSRPLVQLATQTVDGAGIELSQLLLEDRQDTLVADITACGFRYIAELHYLGWETGGRKAGGKADHSTAVQPTAADLELLPSTRVNRRRLEDLVTRTYAGTLDCPELEGLRKISEVINGYQQTGDHDPGDWFVLRRADRDVGVLLLSEHRASRQMELIYVGIVPEARGNRLGWAAVAAAKRIAASRPVERLVLAVDTRNTPAKEIYTSSGFKAWAGRHAFARPHGSIVASA